MVAARDVKSVRTGARNSTAGDDKSMVFAVTLCPSRKSCIYNHWWILFFLSCWLNAEGLAHSNWPIRLKFRRRWKKTMTHLHMVSTISKLKNGSAWAIQRCKARCSINFRNPSRGGKKVQRTRRTNEQTNDEGAEKGRHLFMCFNQIEFVLECQSAGVSVRPPHYLTSLLPIFFPTATAGRSPSLLLSFESRVLQAQEPYFIYATQIDTLSKRKKKNYINQHQLCVCSGVAHIFDRSSDKNWYLDAAKFEWKVFKYSKHILIL